MPHRDADAQEIAGMSGLSCAEAQAAKAKNADMLRRLNKRHLKLQIFPIACSPFPKDTHIAI